ncbi:SDR family oxidoreductase [Streptomyces genisteinicus]|uniref:SDR family oxidoreductase n=1 Tax=Streptomyces genisteinicus TaxID=2768068 RepID=A0A7H0HM14_9ACTN|nr:SDR family oxidoreductase [Streptomyces genisteinicus]QNP61580.1 SDR family oxidoreductase [Streptomyces genisteinicus]
MTRYAGQTAVVVGQETGIGLAIAKRLVEGGAQVLLTVGGRDEQALARAELGSAARLLVVPPAPAPGVLGQLVGAGTGAGLLFADAVPTARPLLPHVRDGGAVVLTSAAPSAAAVGALAGELAGRGIRVNAVAPGCIGTPGGGTDGLPPLGRFGSAEEVARAALFLATDATFTTGARLPVDGGLGRP